jgi:hypothetical protein
MKLIMLMLALLTTFSLFAQKEEPEIYVTYESSPAPGLVSLRCSVFSTSGVKARKGAIRTGLFTVLFRGVPGSQYESPLVNDESKATHPVILDILNDTVSSFVTGSMLLGQEKSKRKQRGTRDVLSNYRVTINYEALRRYLLHHSIIRKFGY